MQPLSGWMLLWLGSGLLQLTGLLITLLAWCQSPTRNWRVFWGFFVVNWLWTLAHQVTWGVATNLEVRMFFWENIFKLGAMLSEIGMVVIAYAVMVHRLKP